MTHLLRQSLSLLQLSTIDLNRHLQAELESNPLLELPEAASEDIADSGGDGSAREYGHASKYQKGDGGMRGGSDSLILGRDASDYSANIKDQPVLRDYLNQQLHIVLKNEQDVAIGEYIIDLIDESGYLRESVEEIVNGFNSLNGPKDDDKNRISGEKVEKVISVMQSFEPTGVFAHDLAQCLTIQLQDKGLLDQVAKKVVENLELLGERQYKKLAKLCECDVKDVIHAHDVIKTLNPKPADGFVRADTSYIIPDVIVRKVKAVDENGQLAYEWKVEINPYTISKLLVNKEYKVKLRSKKALSREDKKYLTERLMSANNLMRALDMRNKTILKVVSSIVARQEKFFESSDKIDLQPMTMQDVADEYEIHKSTVSRAVNNKFVATAHGTIHIKEMFSTAIDQKERNGEITQVSREKIKQVLKHLIENETPGHALSDSQLMKLLNTMGYKIARRTTTKYREELNIPTFGIRNKRIN